MMLNGEELPVRVIRAETTVLRERREKHLGRKLTAGELDQLHRDGVENAIEHILLVQESRQRLGHVPARRVTARWEKLKKRLDEETEESLDAVLAAQGQTRENLRLQLVEEMQLELLYETLKRELAPPSRDEIRAKFDEKPELYRAPELAHAAHILRRLPQGESAPRMMAFMTNLRQRLVEGADFGHLADQVSEDKQPGGDLGYFPRGRMVPAFDRVVFSLQPGEISDIFRTEFGYHLVKVLERIPARPLAFEEVAELLGNQLQRERLEEAIGRLADDLRAHAQIETESDGVRAAYAPPPAT